MKLKLPQYSGKDNLVMMGVVPVFTLYINSQIFGWAYWKDWKLFLVATVITGIAFFLHFVSSGLIAVTMKNRFPHDKEVLKRLTLMIIIFLLITGLFLLALFQLYEYYGFFGSRVNQGSFEWCYFSMGIVNVFLTYLMEGINRYQSWKTNWQENEKLKKTYKERQLQGLKSQVNQHFLFDSLQTLSVLIKKEEDDSSEVFLNAMSKVYRYMLSTDDEPLVTVETELKFLESYRYLLQAKYGPGLQLEWMVNDGDHLKLLPPLSLQSIVENAFLNYPFNDSLPLQIFISSAENNLLKIYFNNQPHTITPALSTENSLEKLVENYKLLSDVPMVVENSATYSIIYLPLLTTQIKKEVAT